MKDSNPKPETTRSDWWRGFMAGAIAMGWVIIVCQFIVERAIP